jgi:transcriptional regulator with XRE-family HTH domain
MVDLRAKGCTLAQIARRVGLTRQAVHEALKRSQVQNGPVICRHCREAIPGTDGMNLSSELMCCDCLDTYPRISFAVRLMSLRTLAGLTQSELARSIGVSQSLISLAERNYQQPGHDLRLRLLTFLESAVARRRRR